MCNVRQSFVKEGVWGAAFLPRDVYKTTIFTIGGSAWEMLINPDVRIRIVNAIFDRSLSFIHTIQRVYDSNPFFAWLYPEYVPPKNSPRWNDKEAVLPNRTSHYTEPNLKCGAVGGESEGDHHDVLGLDDLVGLPAINSMSQSSSLMDSSSQWLRTSSRTLIDWRTGRIVLTATRYAVDDTYSIPWKDCRRFIGFTREKIEVKASGKWIIYNREVEENGKFIFPEKHDKETLAKIKADDPWTAMTQLYNSPHLSGLTEFTQFPDQLVALEKDDRLGEWQVRGEDKNGLPFRVKLRHGDIRAGFDPAATEKGITSRTSRSAFSVWMCDWEARKVLLFSRVGYVSLEEAFDWIFEAQDLFQGMIAECIVESNAFQKVLKDLLVKEREKRGIYVYFTHKPAIVDKDARIRARLGPDLARGKVFLVEGQHLEFIGEKNVFPQGRLKDILDSSEKAMSVLRIPASPKEKTLATISSSYMEEERSAVSGL